MNDRPNYLMGALAGGAVVGVLSALPCIQICCFLWAIAGGILAAFVASRRASIFGVKEGLIASLLASFFALPFNAIITIPLHLLLAAAMQGQGGMGQNPFLNNPDIPEELRELLAKMNEPGNPVSMLMITVCYGFMPALFLGWIGGLLGGLFFKKEGEIQAQEAGEVFQ